jgi:endonuclease/exonuclease/phosphatase family metal-dependent hydrolase
MVLLLTFLLAFGPVAAQDVPAVGSPATFDVATWNIERFDEGGQTQIDNVLAVLQQAEIDLWALQEVNDRFAFDEIVERLGDGWAGTWTNGTGSLGYGFIYRTDVVNFLQASTILDNFSFEFASRPPLLLRADITLPDTTVANVRFIDVHAKCCGDSQSYNRRVDASAALKNYIDNFLAIDAPVIVLGDLNDELRNSIFNGATSPYQNFRDDEDDYTFASYPLDLANVATFCSNQSCTAGSTLDHILVTRPLAPSFIAGSARRYDALLDAIPSYVNTTSDHLPVYAQFDFMPLPTASDDDTAPRAFALDAPFPNPFRDATTLTFALPAPTEIRLEVFDALGRRVATVAEGARPAGTHEATFAARDLPPGLYLVRLTAGSQTATRRLIHVP